jgi:hypothetical protein
VVGVNGEFRQPIRVDEISLPRAEVISRLRWGEGREEVPLEWVTKPSFGGRTPRPLRPVFAFRPDADGLLMMASLEDKPTPSRRFVRRHGGRANWLTVSADTDEPVRWYVLDFQPDGQDGIHLLEFIEPGDGRPMNRVRRVDGRGDTTWSRTGPAGPQGTDPAELGGLLSHLQRPTGGPLWVIPRKTSAGLLALDPKTGAAEAVPALDADFSNLVITPDDRAIYARTVEPEGDAPPMLATTDLTTGRTDFTSVPDVPLLDLAGRDNSGRIYARTADGITRLTPRWELRLHGAVLDPHTGRLTVAYGAGEPDRLLVADHQPSGAHDRTWPLHLRGLSSSSATLIDIEPGPRFVFHVDGSARQVGSLLTVDEHGAVQPTDATDDVYEELPRRESRVDLADTAITGDGGILAPLSDPYGHSVVRFQPPA